MYLHFSSLTNVKPSEILFLHQQLCIPCSSSRKNDFIGPLLRQKFSSLWRASRSRRSSAGKEGTDWIICVSASVFSHPRFWGPASNTPSVISSFVLYSSWHSEYGWWRLKFSSAHPRWIMFEVVGKETLCISKNIKT